jgi:hypothetical protein
MWAGVEEILGDEDGSGTSIRGWATLKFRERFVDHGGLEDLFESIDIFKLGVRVSLRMFVVNASNFCEVLLRGSISLSY